jgi:hypothetical protein
MKGKFIGKIILMVILGIGAFFAFGYLVMALWNHVMTSIFVSLPMISFCQAIGLLILSKILFGGFRGKWGGRCGGCGCGGGRGWKSRWENKWSQMTPEEREKFKKGFGGKCGYPDEPQSEEKH